MNDHLSRVRLALRQGRVLKCSLYFQGSSVSSITFNKTKTNEMQTQKSKLPVKWHNPIPLFKQQK